VADGASPQEIVVRNAFLSETEEVIEVGVSAYYEYSHMMPDDSWIAYEANIRDARSRLQESELIVAELSNDLVGAVTFFPAAVGRVSVVWPDDWAGIRLVAVRPENRRCGIGRMLLEECIRRSRAHDASAVALHTTPLMQLAAKMYRGIGFVRVPDYDFEPRPNFTVTAYKFPLNY
jgi:ribosomal protein S18 acetylase RimI-like enzyme